MTWDYPVWLWSALSLPLIILFHLLVRRRKTVSVPSLLLWNRLLENESTSFKLRRLAADLFLVLQLAAALLLVLAMASPRSVGGIRRIGGTAVIAIDISAGMSASSEVNGGNTRLEQARDIAESLIRTKSPGAEILILAGGRTVRTVQDFTASKRSLLDALDSMAKTDEIGSPLDLVRAAETMASVHPGCRVVVITDGAFDDALLLSGSTEAALVGEALPNAGITGLALRNSQDGGRNLSVSVANESFQTRTLVISVMEDDSEFAKRSLTLPPGGRGSTEFIWRAGGKGALTVSLDSGGEDALKADNNGFLVPTHDGRFKAVLHTDENWFLEAMLTTYSALDFLAASEDARLSQNPLPADLTVADGIGPSVYGPGALLAVHPFEGAAPPLPLRPVSMAAGVEALTWDTIHPVMYGVDLSRFSARRSLVWEPGPEALVLARSKEGPLIACGEINGHRWIATAFDFLESSLPLDPAFPIFMSNALSWLLPGNPEMGADILRAGEEWRLPATFFGESVEIRNGQGRADNVDFRPDTVGFWSASNGVEEISIGVNLLNDGETDLNPRWRPAAAENPSSTAYEPIRQTPGERTFAALLLAAVLSLLLGEWFFQTRIWRRR